VLFSKFLVELSCKAFMSLPKPNHPLLRVTGRRANALVFFDNMKCAPTQQFRNVQASVDLVRSQIAQCANTKSSRRSLYFSSAQIVIATGKLAILARFRDDQRERRRKRDGPNLFATTIEEDGVLSASE
jgi:hypothetical protein